MIPVPSSPEAVLGWSTPIMGDPEESHAVSNYLQQVEWGADGYRRSVQTSSQHLLTLRSSGVTALQMKLRDRLLPGATMIEQSARSAKLGFDSYAASIESIHQRARQQRDRVRGALETIQVQAHEIARILDAIGHWSTYSWATRIPFEVPTPVPSDGRFIAELWLQKAIELQYWHARSWQKAAWLWHNALDAIDEASAAWSTLVAERETAERQLLGTLRETVLGQLLHMADTGSIDPKGMIAFGISGELRGRNFVDPGARNPEVEALLSDELSPEQFAKSWNALGLSAEQVATLPITTLARLADQDAAPAWVQDIASMRLLNFAIIEPRKAYELMGFGSGGILLDEFHEQMLGLYAAWREAGSETAQIPGGLTVQLIGLGNHDGVLTAAISHGDLDRASHIGVNVSGMHSNVGDIGHDAKGARSILHEAINANQDVSFAMVTWIGYKSPHVGNVSGMGRAETGGAQLASFITGLHAARAANEQPVTNFGVFAHSYGSTAAAEALKMIDENLRVDAFVTYGSAGLKNGTTAQEIRATQIYAVHGPGDGLADGGKYLAHTVDPRYLRGTIRLSGGGGGGYLEVSSHDMYTEDNSPSPLNWFGKTGYTTSGTRSVESMGTILARGKW